MYSLISEQDRIEIHLQIGRLILNNCDKETLNDKLFEIVNHFNAGTQLITSKKEITKLAQLNLKASIKAKLSAAYEAALSYALTGLKLLPDNKWKVNYDLTLLLYIEAVESANLSTNFLKMESLAQIVINEAKSVFDKIRVYEAKILACFAQYKFNDIVDIATQILNQLDVHIPKKPGKLHAGLALIRIKFLLLGKQTNNLKNLPEMTDQSKIAAMRKKVEPTSMTNKYFSILTPNDKMYAPEPEIEVFKFFII